MVYESGISKARTPSRSYGKSIGHKGYRDKKLTKIRTQGERSCQALLKYQISKGEEKKKSAFFGSVPQCFQIKKRRLDVQQRERWGSGILRCEQMDFATNSTAHLQIRLLRATCQFHVRVANSSRGGTAALWRTRLRHTCLTRAAGRATTHSVLRVRPISERAKGQGGSPAV